MKIRGLAFWASVLILFLFTASLWAGTTGKIVGTVKDKDTGAPLPGVNIVIKGTTMGAATNLKGEYFIINVRVGTYTLAASMMGYKAMEVANVKVSADITTTLDFELEPTVLVGEVIEVISERPMVQRDVTSSTKLIGSESIERMPVTDFTDVVALQSGAVETGGELSGGLHIRGGRDNEVVYVVDGINVNDPVSNTRGIYLDKNAIEEMSVISGGFNAEYGEAMSGIVNIVTKEGSRDFGGSLEYGTDAPFNGTKLDFGYNKGSVTLGGPVPLIDKMTFFVSSALDDRENRSPGFMPKPHNDQHEKSGTAKLSWRPSGSLKMTLGGNWAKRRFHSYDSGGSKHHSSAHRRSHGNWLKDSYLYRQGNSQISFNLSHQPTANTFYSIDLARFNTYTKYSAQDGKHYNDWRVIGEGLPWVSAAIDSGWYDVAWQRWNTKTEEEAWELYYTNLGYCYRDSITGELKWKSAVYKQEAYTNRYYDVNSWELNSDSSDIVFVPFDLDAYLADVAASPKHQSYLYHGDIHNWYYHDRDEFNRFCYDFVPLYRDRNTTHYTASVSLTSQVNKFNQIKAGASYRKNYLELTSVQFYNEFPYSDHYKKKPLNASAYLQDKIEYEDLTVNAGLRYDRFDPKSDHAVNITNLDLGFEPAKPKQQWSPRLGISFAVSDKSVMYASYGHFFQPVELGELYQSLNANVTTGVPLIGNPDLPPEKTVAYEVGFNHAFNPDLAAGVTAYYKDVKNLLATRKTISTLFGNPVSYTIYLIEDFATVRGMDVTLTKRAREGLSGTVGYSYLDAKGTGSSGREFYYRYLRKQTPIPTREYPLEFDVTHTFKASPNYYLPNGFGPKLMGIKPLSDLNMNLQFTFSSGTPYTPEDEHGNPMEVGSKRLPSTHQTDLRVDKGFKLGRNIVWGLFVDVRNLFNVKNVVDIYYKTGKPDDDGEAPIWDPSQYQDYQAHNRKYGTHYKNAREWWEADYANWKEFVNHPIHYGIPRIIRVGVTVSF